jgi:DNA-binding winged helix-turn-helix (wHTH) protein
LRQQLWPEDTFVDFDHGLNAAVKRLREALGESADSPVFIETLARRGYRFTVPNRSSKWTTRHTIIADRRPTHTPVTRCQTFTGATTVTPGTPLPCFATNFG